MTPPRRPGRPPLDDTDPSVNLHLRLPARQYDEVYRLARQQRVSVPDMLRQIVRVAIKREGPA